MFDKKWYQVQDFSAGCLNLNLSFLFSVQKFHVSKRFITIVFFNEFLLFNLFYQWQYFKANNLRMIFIIHLFSIYIDLMPLTRYYIQKGFVILILIIF